MLASIDSPQGDHVARTPAMAATVRPTTRTVRSGLGIGIRRSDEARVARADARGEQLAVDAARVVAPRRVLGRAPHRLGRAPRDGVADAALREPVGGGLVDEPLDGR